MPAPSARPFPPAAVCRQGRGRGAGRLLGLAQPLHQAAAGGGAVEGRR